jgi:HPt (histidine-containing phosphotransfer) domain-containing protein
MDDYVSKPIELFELRRVLGCWLKIDHNPEGDEPVSDTDNKSIEPAIDIAGLKSMFGTKVRNLLKVFQEETEHSMQALEVALADRNEEKIEALGHKLRGGCSTLRAQKMATLSTQLELNAHSQEWDKLQQWGAELKAAHICVQSEVQVFLNQES